MNRYIDDNPELLGAKVDTGREQFYIVHDYFSGQIEKFLLVLAQFNFVLVVKNKEIQMEK